MSRLEAQKVGDLEVQREALAKIEAQWKGDRTAQQATIAKLKAELNNAQAEYDRYRDLANNGAISKSLLDSKRLLVETASQQVNEANAVLVRLDQTAERQRSAPLRRYPAPVFETSIALGKCVR